MAQNNNSIHLEEKSSVTTIEETDQIYAESTGSADGYLFRTQFTISLPSSLDGGNSDEETEKMHDRAFHSENSVHYQCQHEKEGFLRHTIDFKEETESLLNCPDSNSPKQKTREAVKSDEIDRLKDEIHQLRNVGAVTTESLSEAQDTVARLKEQELALRTELDCLRQGADWSVELANSLQQKLAHERSKVSCAEEAVNKTKKDNRRLERELEYLKSDVAAAEKELKGYKLGYTRLQNELRETKNQLALEKNRAFTLTDEKHLLSQEISHLQMSLDAANLETRRVRQENNELQDKIQGLKESRQRLQSHMQSIQGQFSKELDSLSRQLRAAKDRASLNCKTELRECDEEKGGFVRQTVRSRSTVRSVVSGGNRDSREVPVRKLLEENRLLRMNMRAAADLIEKY
ncbi:myosin-11-like [Cloeon dipterum]|uniref:myosin-11-like n=1 Tax=Cloeon dipterum TaxID=197152 RepID=UPI00321FB020